LYNPQTHEWRPYWANAKDGVVVASEIGKFKDGAASFRSGHLQLQEHLHEIRWTGMNPNSPQPEPSFSKDPGKSQLDSSSETQIADTAAKAR
jgi:hypothetical protein